MPCTKCGPDDPCEDPIILDGSLVCILCGHLPEDHVSNEAPLLPPKGPCPSSGCPQFKGPPSERVNAHTRCIQQTVHGQACRQTYKRHKNPDPATSTASPSSTSVPAATLSPSASQLPVGSSSALPAASSSSSQRGTDRAMAWESPAASVSRSAELSTHQRMVSSYTNARFATAVAPATSARLGSATLNPLGDKGKLVPRVSRQPFNKPVTAQEGHRLHVLVLAETVSFEHNTVESRPIIRPINSSIGLRVRDLHFKARIFDRHRNEANLVCSVRLPPNQNNVRDFIFNEVDNHLEANGIVPSRGFGTPYDGVQGNLPRTPKNGHTELPLRKFGYSLASRIEQFWDQRKLITHARKLQQDLGLDEPTIIIAPRDGYLIGQGHHCLGPKLFQGLITHFERVRHEDDPVHAVSSLEEAQLAIGCFPQCGNTRTKPIHRAFPSHLPLDTTWTETFEQELENATAEDDEDDIAILTTTIGSAPIASSVSAAPAASSISAGPSSAPAVRPSSGRAGSLSGPIPLFLDDAIESDDDDSWASVIQESRRTNDNEEHTRRMSHNATDGAGSSTGVSSLGRRSHSPDTENTRTVRQRTLSSADSSTLAPAAPSSSATSAVPSSSSTTPSSVTSLPSTAMSAHVPSPRSSTALLDYIERCAPAAPAFTDPGHGFVRVETFDLSGQYAEYRTEDLGNIAQAFYEHVIRRMGGPLPVTTFRDVEISIPYAAEAFLTEPYIKLHHGIGQSIPRAFMASAMSVVENDTIWRGLTDDLKVLSTNEVLDAAYEARLSAAGRITVQYLVTHKALPRCISPAFFEAVIRGENAVDDVDWLGLFHPSAARTLRAWGSRHDHPIEDDALHLNACTAIDVFGRTLAEVNSMSIAQRQGLRRQLVAHLALGINVGVHTFDDHPTILAFKKGFDIPLPAPHADQSICSAFGRRSKLIVLALSHMFPTSGQELEDKEVIRWNSSHDVSLAPYEDKWKAYFWRYLKGVGHVDHPMLHEIIPEDERLRLRNDQGLRSRCFLLAATASEVLPRRLSVKIKFAPRTATEEQAGGIHSNVLLEVKSCFTSVTAFIGPSLKEVLDDLPDNADDATGATAFDVALHTILGCAGANSFQMG
ncbi:hypothetical protein V5O48_014269 [Marasmius crinis-equi]|uniref:Uncharacterized protein n=1 Tax=Marasmius crinis-equi TaxID=585013 RepID=A0ABR3EXV4_9AGAR